MGDLHIIWLTALFKQRLGLLRCLPNGTPSEVFRRLHLHRPIGEHTEALEDAAVDGRDGRLAGARVADEDKMPIDVDRRGARGRGSPRAPPPPDAEGAAEPGAPQQLSIRTASAERSRAAWRA